MQPLASWINQGIIQLATLRFGLFQQAVNDQRYAAVLAAIQDSGAQSVLDLGCGEGKFLLQLLRDKQFTRIVGLDVTVQALQRAAQRLGYDRLPPR